MNYFYIGIPLLIIVYLAFNVFPLDKFTWISILSNVLFFMIIQTLFFLFIASKQYNNILNKKVQIISTLSENNEDIEIGLQGIKQAYINKYEEEVKRITNHRLEQNKKITIQYCIIPMTVTIIALLLVSIFMKSNRKWTKYDSINISLILGAYLTEIYIFIFVIRPYELIGDHDIIYNILKSLNDTLNLLSADNNILNLTTENNSDMLSNLLSN